MKTILLIIFTGVLAIGCTKNNETTKSGKKLDKTEAEVKATLALRQRLATFKDIKFDGLECYETSKDKASCSFTKLAITVPHGSFLDMDNKDGKITNIYTPLAKSPNSFSQGDRVLLSGSFNLKYQKPSFSNKEGAPKLLAINLKLESQEKAK